jgi:multidrug efflux pump subunit AcrA (membrane-fusion protein)
MKRFPHFGHWLWAIGIVAVVAGLFLTRAKWWEPARGLVESTIASRRAVHSADDHGHDDGSHDHAPHDHGDHQHGHDDASSLELSPAARANLGLTAEFIQPVQLETFRRSITVPGMIVNRPGRTIVQVSTPMSGVITHVHAVQGEAVTPGTLLFQIRITAEALVSTQTELLKTVGELDVENREIERLTEVTKSGAVPQKTLLERQYAREKLESLLNAQREALRLLGLSEVQIEEITANRRLLSELQIMAPHPDDHSADELHLTNSAVRPASFAHSDEAASEESGPDSEASLILQDVLVHKGQTVDAGETLAVVADFSELYIEGQAFGQDVNLLTDAAAKGWTVSAVFDEPGQGEGIIDGLKLVYSASAIDAVSRTLPFYVALPNDIVRDVISPSGQRFVDWRYRVGQRLKLRVPVEEWPEQIVLPIEAVAREGAEYFVFVQNGDHFDRTPVHVRYRDSQWAVIANDGALFPGDMVARRGAHQMQMALKNKSGGGIDPHAGHTH